MKQILCDICVPKGSIALSSMNNKIIQQHLAWGFKGIILFCEDSDWTHTRCHRLQRTKEEFKRMAGDFVVIALMLVFWMRLEVLMNNDYLKFSANAPKNTETQHEHHKFSSSITNPTVLHYVISQTYPDKLTWIKSGWQTWHQPKPQVNILSEF